MHYCYSQKYPEDFLFKYVIINIFILQGGSFPEKLKQLYSITK